MSQLRKTLSIRFERLDSKFPEKNVDLTIIAFYIRYYAMN